MYEIKYYSVSKSGKPYLYTDTRHFTMGDDEKVILAKARLDTIIERDKRDIENFEREVLLVTVRYMSDNARVCFSEQVYNEHFTL